MTEKNSNTISKEQNNYIYAQIQKINNSLVSHQQQLSKIQDLTQSIKRQSKQISQLQNKLKLMEVYHCQNFKNNERLFYAHNNFDQMQKKMSVLQQIQYKLINRDFQTEKNLENDIINGMETRLKDIEEQLQKNKAKNNVLVKFRRQISPRIINSESTKDISVDHGNLKSQLKKMEKKMHQFILQKFTILQKKILQTYNPQIKKTIELEEYHQEGFNQNINRKNRIKKINSSKQMTKLKSLDSQENHFKTHMNNYYGQNSRKQERPTIEKGKKIEPIKMNSSSSKNKEKKGEKQVSLEKSKSLKKLNKKSSSKSIKDKPSLSSVDEYLRLHSGRR